MPDSLNIASQQHTADMVETMGNHSFHHHHVYKPTHPGGLTDSLPAAATGLKPLATYPLVDDRQGEMPEEYHQTPADSSIMITLLVVSFLLIAYCYKKGSNFFQKIRHGLYSVKRTENHLDEHTSNETLLLTALIAVAVIMEGIVVYSAALQWLPQAQSMSMPLLTSLSVAVAAGFYLFQLICVSFTGYVFASRVDTRLWLQGYNSIQIFLGLALTPLALVMLFAPEHNEISITLAVYLYIIAKGVFFIKSIRIFYANLFQYVYFISYLCAVEIAPLTFFYNWSLF